MSKRRRQLPRRSPRKLPKYNSKTFAVSDSDTDEDAVEYLGTWKNDNRKRQQKPKRGRNTQSLNIEQAITPIIPAPRRTRQTNNNRPSLVNAASQTDSCEMCSHKPKSPEKLKILAVMENPEDSEDESSHHPSTSFPAIADTVSSPIASNLENNDAPNSSSSDVSKESSPDETNVAMDSACAETANESLDQSEQAVPEEGDSTLSIPNHVVEAAVTDDHVNDDSLFNLYFADPVGLGDGIHNNILSIPFPLDELYAIDEDDENNSEDE